MRTFYFLGILLLLIGVILFSGCVTEPEPVMTITINNTSDAPDTDNLYLICGPLVGLQTRVTIKNPVYPKTLLLENWITNREYKVTAVSAASEALIDTSEYWDSITFDAFEQKDYDISLTIIDQNATP